MEKPKITSFDPMAIGKEIRRCRREMELTQLDLSKLVKDKTGVTLTQAEVSLIEKGKGNQALKKIEAIAKVLGKEWKLKDLQ